MHDDFLRAVAVARRSELARSAVRHRARRDPLRTFHLRVWWAVRPRRELACLVTTPDGAAVLGGRIRGGRPVAR
ncbi:hypothetical protein [Pseudonocardia endophytica]|uniref:Uncharacterized protein n=1 Tax=Pseudonocardia endophytica TaxID=401976 RepID=A0A4R1I9N7_PSEEN|nr:hypothetical protein [Pseudonocardia endophytica]TCK26982.1 hypothetical protein EV378_2828 [Pseudonocardia endophytica]